MKKLLLLSVLLLTNPIIATANQCDDLSGTWYGTQAYGQSSKQAVAARINYIPQENSFYLEVGANLLSQRSVSTGYVYASYVETLKLFGSCKDGSLSFSDTTDTGGYYSKSRLDGYPMMASLPQSYGIKGFIGTVDDEKITLSGSLTDPMDSALFQGEVNYTLYKSSSASSWPTSAIVTASTIGVTAIVGWGLYVYNKYVQKKGVSLLTESQMSDRK